MVERARIILGCLTGKRVTEIARQCHTRSNTVIKWRQRFVSAGLKGLRDAPRRGPKRRYDDAFRKRILAVLEQPPPAGQATWDGRAVAVRWADRRTRFGGCCAGKASACNAAALGV